jgi:hypothetical protein
MLSATSDRAVFTADRPGGGLQPGTETAIAQPVNHAHTDNHGPLIRPASGRRIGAD